jgi:hypothetical protein
MKKLRNVLAAALLTIPVLALDASALPATATGSELNPTRSVAATCYVYFMGRWYSYPC